MEVNWEVEIIGDPIDLKTLARTYTTGDLIIRQNESARYMLTSNDFLEKREAREVKDKTKALLKELSGVLMLYHQSHRSLEIGTVTSITADGKKGEYLFAGPEHLHIRENFKVKLIRADGTVEIQSSLDPIKGLPVLANKNDSIAKALRLRGEENLEWTDLYRIYEAVKADTGEDIIQKNG